MHGLLHCRFYRHVFLERCISTEAPPQPPVGDAECDSPENAAKLQQYISYNLTHPVFRRCSAGFLDQRCMRNLLLTNESLARHVAIAPASLLSCHPFHISYLGERGPR